MKLNNYNQRLLNIEQRTKRFMLGALGAMLMVVLLVAYKQGYLVRSTIIYFFAPNAQGLNQGMAVKFIGFKVGSVKAVSMEPNASVRVKVALDNEYVHLIGLDAKARLIKEALVGESVVEIIPGSQQVQPVTQDSVLQYERGQDASSIAESMAAQLQPILSDIRQITSSINNPDGDIQKTLKNLTLVTGELRETVKQFTQLASSGNQKLENVHGKLDKALDSVNANLAVMDKAVPRLVDRAEATLDNVQTATSDIRRLAADSAGELPSFIHNSNALVQDSQDMLEGAKRSWPFSGWFHKPEAQALPVDGYVPPGKP
ncbi:MAG: MlaD family protein [Sideroxydans sp.]|nr:MlaD family protein [Sideroxydans sp.]